MAEEYIKLEDIKNKTFNRNNPTSVQYYCDQANIEIEDFAIRIGVSVDDIVTPIHSKILRYGVNYTLSLFAEDRINFNNSEGDVQGEDIYADMFKRTRYIMQDVKEYITPVMFTGEIQTPSNRAVQSQRLIRG